MAYWARLPQARCLFNSPYHTCKPATRTMIVNKVHFHFVTCNPNNCRCGLQQFFASITEGSLPRKSRQLNNSKKKDRIASKSVAPFSNRGRSSTTSGNTVVERTIPIPQSNNAQYDLRLFVKPDEELPGAGLGLYTTSLIRKGEIIGISENHCGGKRPVPSRIIDPTNKS